MYMYRFVREEEGGPEFKDRMDDLFGWCDVVGVADVYGVMYRLVRKEEGSPEFEDRMDVLFNMV